MEQRIKEQAHKEFDKRFYDKGTPSGLNQTYKTFRHLVDAIRDDFIDSLIDKAVQHEQERIAEKIKTRVSQSRDLIHMGQEDYISLMDLRDILSLITNKSNVNK